MNRIIVIFFFVAGVMACTDKKNVPVGVLPAEKMKLILWDMMRADQFVTNFILPKDSTLNKDSESIKFYQQIFDIHEIDKNEFEKSFAWYQSHPAVLRAIMDSLQKRSEIVPSAVVPVTNDTITPSLKKDSSQKKDSSPDSPLRRIKNFPVN